jgi:PAS domain S-box-containing protein
MVDTTIGEFLRSATRWGESTRVRLAGTVTCSLEDHTFFIQEGSAGVYVFQKPPEGYRLGDRVEVTGLASLGGFSATLHQCTSRRLGPGAPIDPVPVTCAQALEGGYDMRLVQLRGRLTAERPHGREQWVVRDAEGTNSFIVALPAGAGVGRIPEPAEGTLLALTGVCGVRTRDGGVPSHFVLFLRSGADVRVIGGPPWWSPRHALVVLGMALAGLALAAGWLGLLRRQVRRQTDALRRSFDRQAAMEQRFRAIFEASPIPIWVQDAADERLLEVNPAAMQHYGYSRDQFRTLRSSELIVPPEPSGRHAGLRHRTRDGRVIDVEVTATPFQMEGRAAHLVLVTDVSERRRAETALRATQEQFATVFRASPDPILIARASDERILMVNPAFERLFGYRASELVGLTSQEAGLWADLVLRASAISRLRSAGSLSNVEGCAVARDGRKLTLLGSAELVEFNGEHCFLTMVRDISRREAAGRELRESEERFRQLAASIQEVFWLLDPHASQVLYVSPAFARIRGGPAPATEGAPVPLWADVIHPEDRSRVLEHALTRMVEGRYDEEFRIVRADGAVRWIHDRAFPAGMTPAGSPAWRVSRRTSRPGSRSRSDCASPRSWRRSAGWPGAWRTISTTSWPPSWGTWNWRRLNRTTRRGFPVVWMRSELRPFGPGHSCSKSSRSPSSNPRRGASSVWVPWCRRPSASCAPRSRPESASSPPSTLTHPRCSPIRPSFTRC